MERVSGVQIFQKWDDMGESNRFPVLLDSEVLGNMEEWKIALVAPFASMLVFQPQNSFKSSLVIYYVIDTEWELSEAEPGLKFTQS